MIVNVRDVIRSYDFKPMVGRPDCYVEGKVLEVNNTEFGYRAYKIEVTSDKFGEVIETVDGPDNRIGEIVYVPHEVSYNDYPGRVINLSRI